MTVLVLCNVGARDVLQGDRELRPAREHGERLLAQYPAGADTLAFPIIEPCLRYIAARHPAASDRPGGMDRLVLYGTDQPDPAHRPSDTLHFAELAARLLPGRLGGFLRSAEAQPVQGINPALYDEAFEAFGKLFAELPRPEVEACYVILCGGVPACNTALLLQGVRHYGDRLRAVYQPQGGEPQELRAGAQVTDAFREAVAVERLERLDFAGGLPLLRSLGAGPGLVGLATYAAERLAFDFRSAQASLLRAVRDGDRPTREFIDSELRHDLDPLLGEAAGPERLGALLRELYWSAAIAFDGCRYADFLGRVYRFQEAVLRWLVERIFGLSTDLAPDVADVNQARWNEAVAANRHLLGCLEGTMVNGGRLSWKTMGRPTYKAMLAYATKPGQGLDAAGKPLLPEGQRARYATLLERVHALDRLVELRHRTIIGHGFEGVSDALVLEKYKGTVKSGGGRRTPVEGLEEILRLMDLDVRRNPYRLTAEFVADHLRR